MTKPATFFQLFHLRLFHWRLFLLGLPMVCVMLFLIACPDTATGDDVGDGGDDNADAGNGDAGVVPKDAGGDGDGDAGSPGADGGDNDAGTPIMDAGAPIIDGGDHGDGDGGTVTDAGAAGDAGTVADAGVVSGLFCSMDAGPLPDGGMQCTYIKSETPDLEWQGCPAGLSGQDCSNGSTDWRAHSYALTYCDTLSWGGYGDWRLPNVDELRSLLAGCPQTEIGGSCAIAHECSYSTDPNNMCPGTDGGDNVYCVGCDITSGPSNNGCFWPMDMHGECETYWSSSLWSASRGFYVGFDDGNVGAYGLETNNGIRCVRDRL